MSRSIIDEALLGALHVELMTRSGLRHDVPHERTVFQAGTLDRLMSGVYDGEVTVGELLVHGNYGIGTVDHLGGEMVVVDGEAFLALADGSVERVDDSTKTPFAVVCAFTAQQVVSLDELSGLSDITMALQRVGLSRKVTALRLTTKFSRIRLRSVAKQVPPYPPLMEVTKHQREWDVEDIEGTMVGFHFPDEAAGLEVPGIHAHFISVDRTVGGHVLNLAASGIEIDVDWASDLHVGVPRGVQIGPPRSNLSDIAQVEGSR